MSNLNLIEIVGSLLSAMVNVPVFKSVIIKLVADFINQATPGDNKIEPAIVQIFKDLSEELENRFTDGGKNEPSTKA